MNDKHKLNTSLRKFEQSLQQFSPSQSPALEPELVYRCGWEAALATVATEEQQPKPASRLHTAWFTSGACSGIAVALLFLVAINRFSLNRPSQDSPTKTIVQAVQAVQAVEETEAVQAVESKEQLAADPLLATRESAPTFRATEFLATLVPWNLSGKTRVEASYLIANDSELTPLSRVARRSWGNVLTNLDGQRTIADYSTNYSSGDSEDEMDGALHRSNLRKRLGELLLETNAEDYL